MRSSLWHILTVVYLATHFLWLHRHRKEQSPNERYVPNEILIELTADNPAVLTSPAPGSAIATLYATVGKPTIERLFAHIGKTAAEIQHHVTKIRERFPVRTARSLRKAVPPLHRFFTLRFPGKILDMEAALALLRESPEIAHASPNYYLKLSAVPNDPYYASQGSWGQPYADMDATPIDIDGHGTHVAGTIAATGNNGIGISGVMQKAKILPLRVCHPKCPVSAIVQAITYAADMGAEVINMSLGVADFDVKAKELVAIQYAYNLGVVIVAAGGK